LQYVALRYANVYGPRQNPHGEAGVVAIFSQLMLAGKQPRIFGRGDQTRDYVFVQDVVDANMLALEGGHGGVYNVGTGVETDVNQVFAAVAQAIGYAGEPDYAEERLGEISRICLDAGLLRAEMGWTPRYTFQEGIREATAFYKGQAASGA